MAEQSRRSRLLVIGGAERYGPGGTEILRRFVDLAGGRDAELVVVATASAEPAVLEAEYAALFTRLGAGRVRALRLETRAQANDPAVIDALETATGVFFTGGDQLRITTILGGTRTDSALQTLVHAGAIVLGGTSAGAAMMSGTMILGGDEPGVSRAAVRTGPGLEFLPGVLIDMHFAERGRLNRLLSAVALYPHELGLGIDEDTAILADGDTFEVLGTGAVTVVDAGASAEIRVPADGPVTLTGARIHVLPAGCRFELSGRRPSIVDGTAGERELAA
ncbi:cyanophycinase [Actinoplanes friuliensis]|jgi:cyanophycinase|uniref:Cyanophycinase n=1 Tax=Actinoplanes friuliensis DSM 7358 TaxID=1246995 RepID=U5W937_9ACTN|nr:cyanophycinase [Actinoplanes friuliensis]AGZ44451.1 cyanophycinase [Actinoplanes friuliensis DSM 7358]